MKPSFVFPIRIYWEDTDAGGIVFYANYLKFFERARTEWLRSLGIQQQSLKEESGGMFVVSETQIKYFSPARLDDLLEVTACTAVSTSYCNRNCSSTTRRRCS
jgi:acyl-CoA thioester hydrolase